eukprot:6214543-Pleurochrysis_carterae.AAC.3
MATAAAALDSVATPTHHPPVRHTVSRAGGRPLRHEPVAELCTAGVRAPRARVTHCHVGDGKERQERLPRAPCAPVPALSERGSHSRRS